MRIDDIISVINSKIDEKTIERVLLILKKLTISEAKTIINTTNNYTLNAFFELLNQNNGNEIVKLWINSLTEKERNESLLKGEELEKNLML